MSNLPFTEQLKREFAEHLKAMWDQLDDYMVTAMEWPAIDPNTSVSEKYEDEIHKTREIAGGRGMAEAIYIMCPGDYSSSDDVVQLAVDRYMMIAGVNVGSNVESDIPVPPGLGVFVDPAHGAVVAPAPAAPAPAVAPTPVAPVPMPTNPPPAPITPTAPAPQSTSGLTAEQEEAIRTALAGGLSADMLAVSFSVSVDVIRAVGGG